MKHYKHHFKNKVVYCNCDDPRISEFFKYFSRQFRVLGLKKLITTCYKSQNWDLFSKHDSEKAVYLEYEGGESEVAVGNLKGDGDFRSEECIAMLKEADIVVTNPPFSLFREYIAQLIKHEKKFLIVGHQNALGYKEIFPLIQNNKVWLGYGFKGGAGHFYTEYQDYAKAGEHIEGMIRVSGVHWFTNLDIEKRHENLISYREYNEEDYPKYDNYNAINVDKTNDIPKDWGGGYGCSYYLSQQIQPGAVSNHQVSQRG